MAAGNRGVGEAQAGGRLAADDDGLFADREDAALKFAGDGCQSWIHLQVLVSGDRKNRGKCKALVRAWAIVNALCRTADCLVSGRPTGALNSSSTKYPAKQRQRADSRRYKACQPIRTD